MKKLFALVLLGSAFLYASPALSETNAPPGQAALHAPSENINTLSNDALLLLQEDRSAIPTRILPPVEFHKPLVGLFSWHWITPGVALLGLLALCLFAWRMTWKRPVLWLSNISEGVHRGGRSTYKSDAVVSKSSWNSNGRASLLAMRGATADAVNICGAANVPIGAYLDEVTTIGDKVAVQHFGAAEETLLLVASAAIAQDALIEPAAGGKVATLGAGVGTHHVVGRALQAAAADGDVIEVDFFYFLRVI